MDSPYRSAPTAERVEAPRDRGIVGDVVAQFADPLAFLRELVQNAIDAGTATVEVELRHDAAASALRAIVRDRGEGMDRAILEDQLLVLFRSTKDRDPTKIGKFGIGFASVLAPGPRLVTVDTARGGRRLVLHLHTDLTYQVFEGGPAARTGTTVEVELPCAPDAVDALIERCHETLVRWCRHALVPIRLTATDGGGAVRRDVRIDTPLGFDDALVEVRGVSADGETAAVVALLPGGARHAGFFNRGLTLHETTTEVLGRVAFKVQDHRLGHTLSRDDVRRDDAFDRALGVVRTLFHGELLRATTAALAAAARDDGPRWRALVEAIDRAGLWIGDGAFVAPLVAPLGAATTLALGALPGKRAWVASGPSPLVDALAAAGVPVLALADEATAARVARRGTFDLADVHAELILVTEAAPLDADGALVDELAALLARTGRRARAIVFATLHGAHGGALCATGGPDDARHELGDGRWVLDRAQAAATPFGRLRRRVLVVNAADPLVAAVRARAAEALVEAASALARAVLRHHDALDVETSETVLAETIARLGLPDGAP